jgi:uncharacterized protein (DUF58 family)
VSGQRTTQRRSRIRARVTAAGWVFVVVTSVILATAIRHDAAVTLLLLGAMLGALVASSILGRRIVRGLRVARQGPSRCWQGQVTHVSYFLANRNRWMPCLDIQLADLPQTAVQSVDGYCACLHAHKQFRSGGRFIVARRGRSTLKGMEIKTTFPFGLIAVRQRLLEPVELLVWPARGRLKTELLRRGAAEMASQRASMIAGGQDDFFGLREFREDDNPRLIHWRRSAGRAQPLIREMARPLPNTLMVVIDTHLPDPKKQRGLREKLLRLAATLIDRSMTRGYQVGLALGGADAPHIIPPATGRAQLRSMLDELADVPDAPCVGLTQTVRALRPGWVRQAEVIALSPNASAVSPSSLGGLGAACSHLTVIAGRKQVNAVFEDDPSLKEIGHAVSKLQ